MHVAHDVMLKINADWFTGSVYFQNKENEVSWKPWRQKLKFVFVNSLTHSETINLARFKTKRFGKARIMRVRSFQHGWKNRDYITNCLMSTMLNQQAAMIFSALLLPRCTRNIWYLSLFLFIFHIELLYFKDTNNIIVIV